MSYLNIVALPIEALQVVTKHLLAHQLVRLILCGHKQLTQRLTEGGGALEFRFEISPSRRIQWPSIVSSFPRLQTFVVFRLKSVIPYELPWNPSFRDLPQCIRHIYLAYPRDSSQFFDKKHTFTRFSSLETLSVSAEIVNSDWSENVLLLLNRMESLSSIKLYVSQALRTPLPPNTTSAELIARETDFSGQELPVGLTQLSINTLRENLPESFPLLILALSHLEHLTHLGLFFYAADDDISSLEEFALLPRSITSLHITATGSTTVTGLKALPPLLKTLYLHRMRIPPAQICYLPRGLKATDAIDRLLPEDIPHLPPGIRDLKGCKVSLEVSLALPRTVEEIGELEYEPSDVEVIGQLPPALLGLWCNALPSRSKDFLPANMKWIRLKELTYMSDVESKHFCPLPASLSSLSLEDSHFYRQEDYYTQGHEPILRNAFLELLPKNLSTLRMAGVVTAPGLSFGHLPRNLTALVLACDCLPFGSPKTLPASLERLTLTLWEPQDKFAIHLLKNLPAKLLSLTYDVRNVEHDCEVVNDTLSFLPGSITYVSLPFSSLLDNSCIDMLPSSVVTFSSWEINHGH